MKIFNVLADNDEEYLDYEEYELLIGAETKEQAIDIAKNIWNQDEYIEAINIDAKEITTTDNGMRIKID